MAMIPRGGKMKKITLRELQLDLRKIEKIEYERSEISKKIKDKQSILYGDQISLGCTSSAYCITITKPLTIEEITRNEEFSNYCKIFESKQQNLQIEMDRMHEKYESLMNDYSGIIDYNDECSYDDDETLLTFIKNLIYLMGKGLKL